MVNKNSEMRDSGAHEVKEALPEYKRYTYTDYCSWGDDERWELIEGVPYAMSAPSLAHQEIVSQLNRLIGTFLVGKPCKVFPAPVDVRLNYDAGDDTVVQPDLLVVCDKSKLDGKSINGAPDLIIEILSPSTTLHDRILKFRWYLQAGVREYWIVDPDDKTVLVYILKNSEYVAAAYGNDDAIHVYVLEGCTINLPEVFAE